MGFLFLFRNPLMLIMTFCFAPRVCSTNIKSFHYCASCLQLITTHIGYLGYMGWTVCTSSFHIGLYTVFFRMFLIVAEGYVPSGLLILQDHFFLFSYICTYACQYPYDSSSHLFIILKILDENYIKTGIHIYLPIPL